MLAILVSIRIWAPFLKRGKVIVHGDAKSALHAARKMAGRSPALNALAGELGVTCEVHTIGIDVKHLLGAVNVQADAVSRLTEGKKRIPA